MRFKTLLLPASLCTVFAFSHAAQALPLLELTDGASAAPRYIDERLAQQMGPRYNFAGTIKLSNCSGSLISFKGQPMTDKALVMTNGHCLQMGRSPHNMPAPDEVLVNRKVQRRVSLLGSNGNSVGTLQATQLLYGTMTGTDVGLYQMSDTYEDILARYEIAPLVLADEAPALDTKIHVVSGYWRRGYECRIEAKAASLLEGGWSFQDSLRYSADGCQIIGGTSGSPVLNVQTGEVIAINNTFATGDGQACSMDNPCEAEENGDVVMHTGHGYAQQTQLIYSCLDENYHIDLDREGCQLAH